MMRDADRLTHMLDALARMRKSLEGLTREDFLANDDKKAVAERYILIVGEAAHMVSKPLKADHPEIEWQDVVDMRNMVAHEYMQVDYDDVWKVATVNFPELEKRLRAIRDEYPAPNALTIQYLPMQVYNSLTRRNEELTPLENNEIRLYTCGPTVYNFAHIGNFRAYAFEDILRRVVQFNGMKIRQVMNLTDVDDKTIRGANAAGVALTDYTKTYKDAFFADLKKLNIQPAEVYPAATDHIPEMIALVQKLMDKGVAYQSEDGSVYFKVREFPGYGKLAHIDFDSQRTGLRCAADEYDKENVGDFALWKAWEESDGPVGWDSPWGRGRPGWHIECSAMSMKYLGETFDLHTGGIDNLFPHHENEIAQAEAATGKPFVKTWMHCAHLKVNGEKMSKSAGNFFTLRDLLEKGWSGREIRYVLVNAHYRTGLNFAFDALEDARKALRRIDECVEKATDGEAPDWAMKRLDEFAAAVNDDLNLPKAFAALFELVREANGKGAAGTLGVFRRMDEVLGVIFFGKAEKEAVPAEIQAMLDERAAARKAKNWAESDRLRDAIAAQGWLVKDSKEGQTCTKK